MSPFRVNFVPETLTKPVEAGGAAVGVGPLGAEVEATVVVGARVVVGGAGAAPGIHWE